MVPNASQMGMTITGKLTKRGTKQTIQLKKGTWIVSGIQWTPFVVAHI